MRKLLVALPCYSGNINVMTMHSLMFGMEELKQDGWEVGPESVLSRIGDADIGCARNAFLGVFLRTDCTDLLFLDDDVSWGPGVLKQLCSHDVDFVAGTYRAKLDEVKYPIIWPEKKNMIRDGDKTLLEVEGVGFGFVKLTRAGVQKAFDATERKYYDYEHMGPEVLCPNLFEFAWDGEQRKSEDFIFCKRWQDAGLKCWIDPTINIDHHGRKTYKGDLLNYLREETTRHQMAEVSRLQNDAA